MPGPATPCDETNSRDTDRLEAFSDAMIAIVVTLLVIEIAVPHLAEDESHGNRALIDALLDLWPSYLGFVVSFLTIGIMGINHHNIFRFIACTDQRLVVLNTLFLLFVAFIPFATAVMAE